MKVKLVMKKKIQQGSQDKKVVLCIRENILLVKRNRKRDRDRQKERKKESLKIEQKGGQ